MKCMVPKSKFDMEDMFLFVVRVSEREAQEMFAAETHKFVPKRIKDYAQWQSHRVRTAKWAADQAIRRAQRKEALEKHKEMCRQIDEQNAHDKKQRKQEQWEQLQTKLRRKPKYYSTKEDQLKAKAVHAARTKPQPIMKSRRSMAA